MLFLPQRVWSRLLAQDTQLDKLLLFVLHSIARLVELAPSLTVLQLYLMAAQAASEVAKLELIAYECYEQVGDSTSRMRTLLHS